MNNFIIYGILVALVLGFIFGVLLLIQNIKFLKKLTPKLYQPEIDIRNRILALGCSLLGSILLIALYTYTLIFFTKAT